MSGEQPLVQQLLDQLQQQANTDAQLNLPYAEDLLFAQLVTRLAQRRSHADLQHQLDYLLNFEQRNLSHDCLVVTRGC